MPTVDGWLQLRRGQSARVGFFNKGEKSAFVDVEYRPGTTKSDKNQRLGFYVYNKDTQYKVFDMTEAEKVLLPQSSANFQVVLVAENGDFQFKLDYSNSLLGKSVMLGLAMILSFVSFF